MQKKTHHFSFYKFAKIPSNKGIVGKFQMQNGPKGQMNVLQIIFFYIFNKLKQ